MKKADKNPAAVALGRLGGSTPTTKPKGFAAMQPSRRRKLAQSGGLTTQRKKRKSTKER